VELPDAGAHTLTAAAASPAVTALPANFAMLANPLSALDGPVTNSQVGSGGATAAQVQQALDESGISINGSGIKVGVLSDSFNDLGGAAADEADGALPPASDIQVLKDLSSGGTDEGRAMMQIIHDIAPGADLAFYTAFDSEQDFANGILALAAAGCKVIVDDVSYFDEPFFQNGIVAQAIQTVEAEGVTYVTAAGNEASNAYQAAWTQIAHTSYDGYSLSDVEGFGGSPVQTVTVGGNVPLILEWSQPYGGATSDLEILAFQNGNLVGESASEASSNNPWAGIELSAGTYQIAIENLSGPNPGLIKEITLGDGIPVTISGANIGTVYGHGMTPGAITAGAVSAAGTPAFGDNAPTSESFSSSGAGTELLFANNGTSLSSPDDLSPVAVSGVDDISTTVPGGLSDFYGSSAAAASLAGVAALILSADPNLTPAQVELIMEETALPIANSAVSGAGLVQVDPAIAAVEALMAQTQTEVIRTANNDYYVVWLDTSTDEIMAQEFGANGSSIIGPVSLFSTVGVASFSDVAVVSATAGNTGNLELTVNALAGGVLNTYSAQYTPNLNFITGTFLNPLAPDSTGAAVTALPDGNFIVTYLFPQTGSDDLFVAKLSPSGSNLGNINGFAIGPTAGQTSLAALSSGNFVFTYYSANADQILFDVMNENGTILSSGSGPSATAAPPPSDVAALASGGFVIVSEVNGEIDAEVFNSNGNVIRNIDVTDDSLFNESPTVTATADGGFIVAWQSAAISSFPPFQFVEQQFDPTGNPVGSPVTLMDGVSSVASLSDGETAFGFNNLPNNLVLDTRTSVSDAATGGSFLGGGTGDFLLASAAPATNAPGGIVTLDVLNNGVVSQIGQLGTDWSTDLSANFSGNGMDGLLAHQTVNEGPFGIVEFYDIFQMTQNGLDAETPVGTWGTGWQAVGSGNFAGASAPPDVLMQLVSGGFDTLQVAFIGANNAQEGVEQVGVLPSTVQAVGAGNFNGSGTDEILLKSQVGGGNIELEVLNITNGSVTPIGTWGSNWTVDGVGSFGGAGTVGILLEEDTSAGRTLGFATIQNNALQSFATSGPIGYNLVIDGIGDFAGNGTSDIAVHYATATSATGPTTTDAWLQIQNNAIVGGLHTAGITGPNFLPR
jgi:hypothetical protein